MAEGTATLTIGQVAERTGLSVHALRYYEREGLVAEPVRRGRNGHRLYSQDDVVRPNQRATPHCLERGWRATPILVMGPRAAHRPRAGTAGDR